MEPGGTWERLLQTPTTWIVVAVVLFVIAVVLLVAGALAGRRARREQRARASTAAVAPPAHQDDPVTEPAVPRRESASLPADGDDPVTQPAEPRTATSAVDPSRAPERPGSPEPSRASEPARRRLLGVLVGDPEGALAGVAALERGEEPGRAAVTLLRSGVPSAAVARLCGVDADDLGDLVATTLGILPSEARSALGRAERPGAPQVTEGAASAQAPTPTS